MQGFREDGLKSNPVGAFEYYNRVIEVLQWGRHAWRDASKDDRGAIFQPTFLTGVKCLRLDTLVKVRLESLLHLPSFRLNIRIVRRIRKIN